MRKKGFTLAEVLTCLVVIGIIAAILMSNLKMQSYNQKAFVSNARKIIDNFENASLSILEEKKDFPLGTFVYQKTSEERALRQRTGIRRKREGLCMMIMQRFSLFIFSVFLQAQDPDDIEGADLRQCSLRLFHATTDGGGEVPAVLPECDGIEILMTAFLVSPEDLMISAVIPEGSDLLRRNALKAGGAADGLFQKRIAAPCV